MTDAIRFDDGAAYECYMGVWSWLVGERFLDWLAPAPGLCWLDVGCGSGAFTERIVEHCAPAAVDGIDPSDAQLAFARTRPAARIASFHRGDAMAAPFAAGRFDVAVLPLVIFYVPEPPRGIAEMARVVRPGGLIAAYAWDLPGGGFPYAALQEEIRTMGFEVPMPPSVEASRLDALESLWTGAGLVDVETRTFTVERTFADFDDWWLTIRGGPSVARPLAAMNAEQSAHLAERMRARLPVDASGRITVSAWANAVKGRVAEPRSERQSI